ncbi:ergot alkaloid biosynthesis protein [Nonomuraea sp. NPDC050643]|uniref:ergot alkaloid biosynthesis protein n=1 Tax=Nonomuraea sp. NPDC050643 TaxID=3155660 RepID=UPI0033ED45E4
MADVLVIGATGTTGSRVAAFLRDRGVPVRPASRRHDLAGHVRFDWAAPETHAPALSGAGAVYLVAPIGVAEPAPLVAPFLDEAARQGVRRVVLLGSSAVPEGATGLGALYRLVRDGVPEWTVLRASWFMQNFAGDALALRARDGELLSATGQGRVAFIDAGDIASVAGHALIDEAPHNTEHVLTGPEPLSYADVAAALTRRTGRPLRHRAVTADELARHFAAHGLPPDFAATLAALDTGIGGGSEDRVTGTVERVTGRPARTFREFCARELR